MLVSLNPDPRKNRPLIDILCRYLREYLALAAAAPGVSDLPENATALHPRYPFDRWPAGAHFPDGRSEVVGWPSKVGGPSPETLALPGGSLTQPCRDQSWARIGSTIFVMVNQGEGGGFGSRGLELDMVGLAVRLIRDSIPSFKDWESVYTSREFEVGFFRGDMVPTLRKYWRSALPHPLHVIVRDHIEGNDATGRGQPADRAATMGRLAPNWGRNWADCVTALEDLRAAAVTFWKTGSGLEQSHFWGFAWRLGEIAELLLHEAGHAMCWAALLAETGVTGGWYNGPSYRGNNAARRYDFPPGIGVIENPPVTRHYTLTFFSNWWHALLRHNRGPLDHLQRNACRCLPSGGPGREYPFHGGWYDGECRNGPWAGYDADNRGADGEMLC